MQVRICPNCSREVAAERSICPFCNSTLSGPTIDANNSNNYRRPDELSGKQIAGLIAIAIVVILLMVSHQASESSGSSSSNSNSNAQSQMHTQSVLTDDTIMGCANWVMQQYLLNPSSAIVNSASIYERQGEKYIVKLDISGQNRLGGYNRVVYYVFIQDVTADGKCKYNPTYAYTENFNLISMYKDLNGWEKENSK